MGIRSLVSGTHCLVSSSVDQITCSVPAQATALAMAAACVSSRSGELCSQKFVTQNTAWAPSNARFSVSARSRSAATTSAPHAASARAAADSGRRVTALTENAPAGSARMARASEPPCPPVAPTIATIL